MHTAEAVIDAICGAGFSKTKFYKQHVVVNTICLLICSLVTDDLIYYEVWAYLLELCRKFLGIEKCSHLI